MDVAAKRAPARKAAVTKGGVTQDVAARLNTIEAAVEVLRKWLVGDIDEATGQPVNGIIRRLYKLEMNQKVGFGILASLSVANLLKLNQNEVGEIIKFVMRIFI
jgi:hypothetical protein